MLFSYPQQSKACSCAERPSVKKELASKKAIFSGKVIQIKENKNKILRFIFDQKEVLFQVDQVWEGEVPAQVLIYTSFTEASCGYPFEENKEYLVYAGKEEGHLITTICDRTDLLSNATKDLEQLGEVKVLSKNTKLENKAIGQNTTVNLLPVIILVILVIGVLFKKRKGNR